MATVISVDGEHGATLARSSGIRLVEEDSQALVLPNLEPVTRNGQPGRNAPQAVRGGPAGTLAVQLSESIISHGAIRLERVEYSAAQHPPRSIEVPIGRDLMLTAIGGNGESGNNGGDGTRGMNGLDGTGATKASDATNGSDGGRGGDAGRGSNGGDGGPGGAIHIIMNQNSTHLLMATSWNVSGGQGGLAGTHGKPGAGGAGGKGGQGWRWDEIVGYKPYCTDSCIKNADHASNSAALSRVGTRLNASGQALAAQTRALTVSGNNLQSMITQAAIRYNALRQPRTDDGACKCGGGSGSCAGCDVKPIIKTFQRAPGLDGKEGQRGTSITTTLRAGQPGPEGIVSIAVYGDDGSTQVYSSPWSLELVDFEVEDENGDGIFEPGEHLFIRRIRVRNVGGMPSPTCRIPVTLASDSEWFAPVPAHQGGLTFLPASVPAGESASIEGAIKVRIKDRSHRNSRAAALSSRFSATDRLSIRADMPWLDRRMPSFDFTKEVKIGYPCSLENIQHLSTIAQGAVSKVQYEVHNMSNRPIGEPGPTGSGRVVEVRSTLPANFGRLVTEAEEELEVVQTVACTRAKDSLSMQQQFRVLPTARNHMHFRMIFELYLEGPLGDPSSETAEMILVERHTISLQVANTYTQTPNASVLLVTNPKTTERQSRAIQHFVRSELGMEIDLCNIHQNGGLLRLSDNDFDEPFPITAAYREKSVLIIDSAFDFFGIGDRTASQLFDPQWLFDMARDGTSSLFLGCDDDTAFERVVRSAVSPPPVKLEDAVKKVRKSHFFTSPQAFVDAIRQEKHLGTTQLEISAIPLRQTKWYRFGRDRSQKQAKALVRYLCDHLPNERFLVSFVSPRHRITDRPATVPLDPTNAQEKSGQGYLIILPGLDRQCSIASTESGITCMPINENHPTQSRLDELSRYNIVAALPFGQRARMLWRTTYSDAFVLEAISLSMVRDVFQQIQGLLDSVYNPLVKVDETDLTAIETFFSTHLPSLGRIFNNPEAKHSTPAPPSIVEVLQWILAFSASMKRHKRLNSLIRATMQHLPSTRTLDTSALNVDPAAYQPDALISRIAELTKTPEYRFTKGEVSANTVVPRTRYCAPGEWNGIVLSVDEWRERLENDMASAQKELGRMLLDVTPPDAVELSAGG